MGSAPFAARYALMKLAWLCSSSALSWMYWGMSLSSTERALVYALFPVPPGRSLSWIPPSSLYCSHRSASSSSAAARNCRTATSPFVSPPLADTGGAVSNRLAPMAPAPTAAPFSRNERRSVRRPDCSTSSMIFTFRSSGERRVALLAVMTDPTMRPAPAHHNSAALPPDRTGRSDGEPHQPCERRSSSATHQARARTPASRSARTGRRRWRSRTSPCCARRTAPPCCTRGINAESPRANSRARLVPDLAPKRNAGGDERAAAGRALDPELAVEHGEPVAEPDEAVALGLRAADAVVAHPDLEEAVLDARIDGRVARPGVLGDVGQRLGDDEVGRRLDRGSHPVLGHADRDRHRHPVREP